LKRASREPIISTSGHMRNRALDGLRAVAVIFVLIIHSGWNVPLLKDGGAAGVDIFFVLSGYLITRILRKELIQTRGINWLRFCLNRLIRLWPALLTVVALSLIPGFFAYSDQELLLKNAVFGVFFAYIWFSGFLNGQELAFGHLWTLSIEQSFYLVFPLVLVFLFKFKISRVPLLSLLLLTGSSMLLGTSVAGYLWPHFDGPEGIWGYARAGGLLFGAGIAVLLEISIKGPKRAFEYVGVGLLLASLILAGNIQLVGLSFLLASVGSAFLTYAFASSQNLGFVGRILSNKQLAYVGLISYEIYLWHFPLLNIGATANGQSLQTTSLWAYPLAFVLSVLTHHLWLPAQTLLRRKLNAWLA